MTTMLKAYSGVEAEIIDRIQKIVPNAQSKYRFVYYSDEKQANRPIEEFTGRPRIFRLGDSSIIQTVSSCYGSHRVIRNIPLNILYPVDNFESANWNAISSDDFNLIRADLLNNTTTVDGVSYRIIERDSSPTYNKYNNDPWHLMTCNINVYFDVTTS